MSQIKLIFNGRSKEFCLNKRVESWKDVDLPFYRILGCSLVEQTSKRSASDYGR